MASKAINLESATLVEDVERLLDELLLQEAQVDTKLETLLDPDNQPDLTALTTLESSLDIEAQILQLNERIGPAAETASGLSQRVKKLDLEQARVKESLKYVEDVQELKVHSQSSIFTFRVVFWVFMRQWRDKTGMRRRHFFIRHLSSILPS